MIVWFGESGTMQPSHGTNCWCHFYQERESWTVLEQEVKGLTINKYGKTWPVFKCLILQKIQILTSAKNIKNLSFMWLLLERFTCLAVYKDIYNAISLPDKYKMFLAAACYIFIMLVYLTSEQM